MIDKEYIKRSDLCYKEPMKYEESNITFTEYQNRTRETAVYPDVTIHGRQDVRVNFIYPLIGISGEVGEIEEKFKKIIRDDNGIVSDSRRVEISKEIGDCLWYISEIANSLGLNLGKIAEQNLEKLKSRKDRNVIHGSGDNR